MRIQFIWMNRDFIQFFECTFGIESEKKTPEYMQFIILKLTCYSAKVFHFFSNKRHLINFKDIERKSLMMRHMPTEFDLTDATA